MNRFILNCQGLILELKEMKLKNLCRTLKVDEQLIELLALEKKDTKI